ncbi:hypothetical protein SDC9_168289 [bioreactor metagenome]|uniref:Uncharacterized protein n=1 Tax=bioreactor metagenome TaxID=1076179 RepID=A0A645G4R5_9ZZZZ
MIEQQRVAVRRRAGHLGHADGAACACGVVDDDGGAIQGFAQCFRQITRDAVGGAACGERDHDGDGLALFRVALCGHAKCRDDGGSGYGEFECLLHDDPDERGRHRKKDSQYSH